MTLKKIDNIEVVSFSKEHITSSADIFIGKYKRLRDKYPYMPVKYEKREEIIKLLEWICKNHYGVVALRENLVVGFMCAIEIEEFKSSSDGIYIPEWGHGSVGFNIGNIYEHMYQKLSKEAKKRKQKVHSITILEYETELIETLNLNGFGIFVIDAIKDTNRFLSEAKDGYVFEKAEKKDFKELKKLLKEHYETLKEAPTFLYSCENYEEIIKKWFDSKNIIIWKLIKDDRIVGMVETIINADNACTIVSDKKTLAIGVTQIMKNERGSGLGEFMVRKICDYASSQELNMISVDFESANILARRFWLKYFTPCCYSMIRYIDDRIC